MRRLVAVVLAGALPACGPDLGGLRSGFSVCGGNPDPCSTTPPPCDSSVISSALFFSWTIDGFTREQLTDPNARTDLVVQLRVGQIQQLSIEGHNTWGVDCTGEVAAVRWGASTSGVVTTTPNDALATVLSAVGPGDTSLFADLDFKNGQHAQARPFLFTNTSSGSPIIHVVP